MKIELVTDQTINKLYNLLQLYLHDLSNYFPIDFDNNTATYKYDNLDNYIKDKLKFAYLIKKENDIVGFSLVDIVDNTNTIQEMFIINNYKNKGYGKEAVFLIFNNHKGDWLVKAVPCSKKAENFWTRTINEYTKGNYTLEHTGKYNRPEYRFNNEKR